MLNISERVKRRMIPGCWEGIVVAIQERITATGPEASLRVDLYAVQMVRAKRCS